MFSPFHYLTLWHSSKAYHGQKLICRFWCYQAPAVSSISCALKESLLNPGKPSSGFPLEGSSQNGTCLRASARGGTAPTSSWAWDHLPPLLSFHSYCVCVYLPAHDAPARHPLEGRTCLTHLCKTWVFLGLCLTWEVLKK